MKIYVFKVVDMHCSGCANKIENGLRNVDGVDRVNISLLEKKVMVVFDPVKISEHDLKRVVENLGYTVE